MRCVRRLNIRRKCDQSHPLGPGQKLNGLGGWAGEGKPKITRLVQVRRVAKETAAWAQEREQQTATPWSESVSSKPKSQTRVFRAKPSQSVAGACPSPPFLIEGVIFKSQDLANLSNLNSPRLSRVNWSLPDQNPATGLACLHGDCTPRTPPVHISQGRTGTLPGSDSVEVPSSLFFAATLSPGEAAPCLPAPEARA